MLSTMPMHGTTRARIGVNLISLYPHRKVDHRSLTQLSAGKRGEPFPNSRAVKSAIIDGMFIRVNQENGRAHSLELAVCA